MDHHYQKVTPAMISGVAQQYLEKRAMKIMSVEDQSSGGREFIWCGEVLDFLVEGLVDHVRELGLGLVFHPVFPGPIKLWDEDQQPDGVHVRRYWTTAIEEETHQPIGKICTFFYHRHDTTAIPQLPRVVGFPPNFNQGEDEENELGEFEFCNRFGESPNGFSNKFFCHPNR